MNREILEGINLQTLEITPGQTIMVTVDPEKVGIDYASEFAKTISNAFPQNNVVVLIKGLEIMARD